MQIWDIRRAIQALRTQQDFENSQISLYGSGDMAALCLYASLFENGIMSLELDGLPVSHQQGPALLNVMRFLDLPQTVAMAASRGTVTLTGSRSADWKYPAKVSQQLGWDSDRFKVSEQGNSQKK